jgi:hypothetical protein
MAAARAAEMLIVQACSGVIPDLKACQGQFRLTNRAAKIRSNHSCQWFGIPIRQHWQWPHRWVT